MERSVDFIRGARLGISLGKLTLMISDNDCYEFLIYCPAESITEYKYEPEKTWRRGKFTRVGNDKYLFEYDIKFDNASESPAIKAGCKLFRDENRFNPDGSIRYWTREEYCIKGTVRWHDAPDRPQDTGWWEVYSERVDSATPPPNDAQNWRKIS